jgi:hypothetical protein
VCLESINKSPNELVGEIERRKKEIMMILGEMKREI